MRARRTWICTEQWELGHNWGKDSECDKTTGYNPWCERAQAQWVATAAKPTQLSASSATWCCNTTSWTWNTFYGDATLPTNWTCTQKWRAGQNGSDATDKAWCSCCANEPCA